MDFHLGLIMATRYQLYANTPDTGRVLNSIEDDGSYHVQWQMVIQITKSIWIGSLKKHTRKPQNKYIGFIYTINNP